MSNAFFCLVSSYKLVVESFKFTLKSSYNKLLRKLKVVQVMFKTFKTSINQKHN